MKFRTFILTLVTVAITASTLTGCVVVPARGYVAEPPVIIHGYYAR